METTIKESMLAYEALFISSPWSAGMRILCLVDIVSRKLFHIATLTHSLLNIPSVFESKYIYCFRSSMPQLDCCCQCSL